MTTEFTTIGLVGRFQTREVGESLGAMAAFLRTQGVSVLIDESTAASTDIQGYEVVSTEALGARAKLVIVLGGDGTMLNAARQMAEYSVPVVGVNQGRLGFMTDISRDNMLEGIAAILEGKYTREERVPPGRGEADRPVRPPHGLGVRRVPDLGPGDAGLLPDHGIYPPGPQPLHAEHFHAAA